MVPQLPTATSASPRDESGPVQNSVVGNVESSDAELEPPSLTSTGLTDTATSWRLLPLAEPPMAFPRRLCRPPASVNEGGPSLDGFSPTRYHFKHTPSRSIELLSAADFRPRRPVPAPGPPSLPIHSSQLVQSRSPPAEPLVIRPKISSRPTPPLGTSSTAVSKIPRSKTGETTSSSASAKVRSGAATGVGIDPSSNTQTSAGVNRRTPTVHARSVSTASTLDRPASKRSRIVETIAEGSLNSPEIASKTHELRKTVPRAVKQSLTSKHTSQTRVPSRQTGQPPRSRFSVASPTIDCGSNTRGVAHESASVEELVRGGDGGDVATISYGHDSDFEPFDPSYQPDQLSYARPFRSDDREPVSTSTITRAHHDSGLPHPAVPLSRHFDRDIDVASDDADDEDLTIVVDEANVANKLRALVSPSDARHFETLSPSRTRSEVPAVTPHQSESAVRAIGRIAGAVSIAAEIKEAAEDLVDDNGNVIEGEEGEFEARVVKGLQILTLARQVEAEFGRMGVQLKGSETTVWSVGGGTGS